MEMTVAHVWQSLFANWPPRFRRKGVVIPMYDESIPFVDFVLGEGIVILERPTPDGVGGRRVAVPLARIEAVKYTEPITTQDLIEAGFKGAPQRKPPGQPQAQRPVQRPAPPGVAPRPQAAPQAPAPASPQPARPS